MRTKVLTTVLAPLGLFFLLLPAAQAQQVQVYFTGNTPNGQDNPYLMVISPTGTGVPQSGYPQGVQEWLNCDDHHDYIQTGEAWTANVFLGSANDLAGTEMSLENTWTEAQADMAYDAKAWIELYSSPASNPAYSDAIWSIFDNAYYLSNCQYTACQTLYNEGMAAATADGGGTSYRQNLTIYSYEAGNWISGQYDGYPAQEFDGVPDGGLTLMLLGGALVGLETLRRKFRV